MPHISRRELKQDQLRTTYEEFEEFFKQKYREILTVVGIVVVVGGLAGGLRVYQDRREAEADLQLGIALRTFRAYVGSASQVSAIPGLQSFPTAQAKYQKALEQFQEVIQKQSRFPQPKSVEIARYHVGLCQARLGDTAAALKTLEEASRSSDPELAALAQYALAGELVKTGKIEDAAKIYNQLASHPTSTVPEAAARLALADAYRATQPAKAREIYQQLEKKFGSDVTVAQALKDQIATLPSR
ncbi:MAG: tetratricopeptide repeat protein [Acidobacteriia bacterium]|nr:tetratricopeptide repeat protein [Terriglobia bacterium]